MFFPLRSGPVHRARYPKAGRPGKNLGGRGEPLCVLPEGRAAGADRGRIEWQVPRTVRIWTP